MTSVDESSVYIHDVSDTINKENIPILIGKGGRNMKQCIKRMYEQGCENPNFRFVVSDDDKVSVHIKHTSEEELKLILEEVNRYFSHWLHNKEHFNPARQHSGNREHTGSRFTNNLLLHLDKEGVSGFIGEGGSHIKEVLDKLNTELELDNKIQIHIKNEDELVYAQITLFSPHAYMRDYIKVETALLNHVDEYIDNKE